MDSVLFFFFFSGILLQIQVINEPALHHNEETLSISKKKNLFDPVMLNRMN